MLGIHKTNSGEKKVSGDVARAETKNARKVKMKMKTKEWEYIENLMGWRT